MSKASLFSLNDGYSQERKIKNEAFAKKIKVNAVNPT